MSIGLPSVHPGTGKQSSRRLWQIGTASMEKGVALFDGDMSELSAARKLREQCLCTVYCSLCWMHLCRVSVLKIEVIRYVTRITYIVSRKLRIGKPRVAANRG